MNSFVCLFLFLGIYPKDDYFLERKRIMRQKPSPHKEFVRPRRAAPPDALANVQDRKVVLQTDTFVGT